MACIPADLLLALMLTVSSLPRYADYQAQSQVLEETRKTCAALAKTVEERGEEADRLLKSGRREEARAVLRRTHDAAESLTDCHKRQKALERSVRELIPEARREVARELDRWLGMGLSKGETYAHVKPLLPIFESLSPPAGCPSPVVDEVDFAAGEPPSVLEEKRLLVGDILRRVGERMEHDGAKVRELEHELNLRRQLSHLVDGLKVEGGTSLFEIPSSDGGSRERLDRIEEELGECRRALQLGEAARGHWEDRLAALDRLRTAAPEPRP
jgi:hypothetical protein